MAPKMLLVFCDGTGMDGNLSQTSFAAKNADLGTTALDAEKVLHDNSATEMAAETPVGGGGGNKQFATNVIRLARSVKLATPAGKEQIVFYQSGVGSEANFAGDPVTGTTALQALGTAVASKIRDAYCFVAQNFEVGDEICIFGFSRGAYTARKLSGLIDRIGLLQTQDLGQFFKIWRQLVDNQTPTIPSGTRHPRIKCVGVWDTVGSVYGEVDALAIKDTSLPPTIDVALHAISLQENRKKFLPTLWTVPSKGIGSNQILKQIWFPGAHSDVGGGYERHELADIALFWMVGEIEGFVALDTAFLRSTAQEKPDQWGTSQPHNAYMETPIPARYVVGTETRLQSNQIALGSVFHESVKYSPQTLVAPYNMVTLSIVQQSLGPSFQPGYPPLNTFEAYCKQHWGEKVVGGPANAPVFENPSDIIKSPVYWAFNESGILPQDAIVGGHEVNGDLIYVARASYKGGLYPGKFSYNRAYISYGGDEIEITSSFERLVGNNQAVRWVTVQGNYSPDKLKGAVPVHGGYEADGTDLYVAQAALHNGVHCGDVAYNGLARLPYEGKSTTVTTYNVLVYA